MKLFNSKDLLDYYNFANPKEIKRMLENCDCVPLKEKTAELISVVEYYIGGKKHSGKLIMVYICDEHLYFILPDNDSCLHIKEKTNDNNY